MKGIDIVLIGTGLFGMLPPGIILYKRRKVQKILDTGLTAKARIYRITTSPKYGDTVHYCFYAQEQQLAYGTLHCKPGLYQIDDVIDIYFLPGNPKQNTVQGAWKSPGMIGFGVVIALFIWFAVYKLFEMVNRGEI